MALEGEIFENSAFKNFYNETLNEGVREYVFMIAIK